MDERIVISVQDRIAGTIPTKFVQIAKNADKAATAIERLKAALAAVKQQPALDIIKKSIAGVGSASAKSVGGVNQLKQAMASIKSPAALVAIRDRLQQITKAATSAGKALAGIKGPSNLSNLNKSFDAMARRMQAMAPRARSMEASIKSIGAKAPNNAAWSSYAMLVKGIADHLERANKAAAGLSRRSIPPIVTGRTTPAQTQAMVTSTTNLGAQKLQTEQAATMTQLQRLQTEFQRTRNQVAAYSAALTKAAISQNILNQSSANAAYANARASTMQAKARFAYTIEAAKAARATALAAKADVSATRAVGGMNRTMLQATESGSALYYSMRNLAFIFSSIASVGGAKLFVSLADAFVGLENKVKMTNDSVQAQEEIMRRLGEVSRNTYGDLESLVTLYARMDRANSQMGRSQSDSIRQAETISKALTVYGLTARESAAVTLQLSQAFNSGRLNGDEFRSVSEAMPAFLDAVSQATGKSATELKKMASEGEITAAVMVKAMDIMGAEMDRRFTEITPRISQAGAALKTSAMEFVASLDKQLGITEKISAALLWAGQNMETVASTMIAAASTIAAFVAGSMVAFLAVNPILIALIAFGAALSWTMQSLIGDFLEFSKQVGGLKVAIGLVKMKIIEDFNYIGDVIVKWAKLSFLTMTGLFSRIGAVFASVLAKIADGIAFLSNAFGALNAWALEVFTAIGVTIYNCIASAINKAIVKINELIGSLPEFMNVPPIEFRMDPLAETKVSSLGDRLVELADQGSLVGDAFRATEAHLTRSADNIGKAMYDINQEFDAAHKVSAYAEAVKAAQIETEKMERLKRLAGENAMRADDPARAAEYAAETAAAAESAGKDAAAKKEAGASLEKILADMDKELGLLKLIGREQEIERQVQQHVQALAQDGVTLAESELALLREKIGLLEKEKRLSEIRNQIVEDTLYKRQDMPDYATALAQVRDANIPGFTKGDLAGGIMGSPVGDFLANSQVDIDAQLSQLEGYYELVDAMRQQDLISEQTASAARMAIWAKEQDIKTARYSQFFGYMAQLAQSGNEKVAAIGKAAAIAQGLIDTYKASIAAYSAMAGIPVVGPALGAAAAAAVTAAGLANVASIRSQSTNIPGYRKGGYTGNGALDEVAGAVHRGEFVMNASSVDRLGIGTLEALQNGTARVETSTAPSYGAQSAAPAPVTNVSPNMNIFVVGSEQEANSMASSMPGNAWFVDMARKNRKTLKRELEV